jgi:hypothetical protein
MSLKEQIWIDEKSVHALVRRGLGQDERKWRGGKVAEERCFFGALSRALAWAVGAI